MAILDVAPETGAQAAGDAVISICGIEKKFGGLRAIDNCSFDVLRGSITGLIGPNGAGKTTLFHIVAGFLRPDSGQILFEGRDVTGLAPHELFRRGLVRNLPNPPRIRAHDGAGEPIGGTQWADRGKPIPVVV